MILLGGFVYTGHAHGDTHPYAPACGQRSSHPVSGFQCSADWKAVVVMCQKRHWRRLRASEHGCMGKEMISIHLSGLHETQFCWVTLNVHTTLAFLQDNPLETSVSLKPNPRWPLKQSYFLNFRFTFFKAVLIQYSHVVCTLWAMGTRVMGHSNHT